MTPGAVVGADGTVYASSNAGILHAIDAVTGRDRWTYDAHATVGAADLSVSPLILPDGVILYPAPGSELVALTSAGKVLWTQTLPGRPTSPATVNGTRVYVGDESGAVSAVDVQAGGAHRLVWTVNVGGSSLASVVAGASGRLYMTSGTSLVAVDDRGANAVIAWRADPHDGNTEVSAGLAPDGTVLLGTNGTHEWAYHSDGSLAWHATRAETYSSPAVTASGLAYVADHSGTVHVFDATTGTEKAAYRIGGTQIWSSTVVDRNYRVYFGGQNGHVYGLSAAGTVLFDVNIGSAIDSYPALTADGALIVGAGDGTLMAIG